MSREHIPSYDGGIGNQEHDNKENEADASINTMNEEKETNLDDEERE